MKYIHGHRQTTSSSTQTRQHALSSHQTQKNTAHSLNYKIDNITVPMNINPKIPQTHIQQTHRNHNNKSTQDNTDTQSTHINNMGVTKGNDHRNIQSHNKTHTQVRFHHMVVVVYPLP